MLRSSIRSIRRPARPYVCLLCLATDVAPRARPVRFYSNGGAASHVDPGSKPDATAPAGSVRQVPKRPLFSHSPVTSFGHPPVLGSVISNNQDGHGDNVRSARSLAGGSGSEATPNGKTPEGSRSMNRRSGMESKKEGDQKPHVIKSGIEEVNQKGFPKLAPQVGGKRKAKKQRAKAKAKGPAAGTEIQTPKIPKNPKAQASAIPTEQDSKFKTETSGKPPVKQPATELADATPLVRSTYELEADSIQAINLEVEALNTESSRVPDLSYGLDRVLFNPGVYQLQDPRTRVYNFDPYLSTIMPVREFDFNALNEYITSSRDEKLCQFAKEQGKKYVGSSSSMTAVLSHFHFLLSSWRPIETSMMSRGFTDAHNSFTRISRAPSAVFLRYKDGVYAIDADKEFDSANILMNLGKSMEKLLTMPSDQFERYRKTSENKMTADEVEDEIYHYTTLGDFLMRAQLDAHDSRLPGTGMFDLKTRAVVSIRHDSKNPDDGMGYQIKGRHGDWESFEREYYDMIRSAFLKYSLQVRMGRMDGIFVAFHNIQRIFGFQYVSLPEMDKALHGQEDTWLGDAEFKLSLILWNKVLDQVTAKFPNQSLRLHFETREATVPFMYIFAEPVTEEDIDAIQATNEEKVEEIQSRLLNPELDEARERVVPDHIGTSLSEAGTGETELVNDEVSASGTVSVASDPKPPQADKSASTEVEDPHPGTDRDASAATDTGIPASSVDGSFKPDDQSDVTPEPHSEELNDSTTDNLEDELSSRRSVFGLGLSVQNVVNGQQVERPTNLGPGDSWVVKYRMSTFKSENRGLEMYEACQRRREKELSEDTEPETEYRSFYKDRLRSMSSRGTEWRRKQDMVEKENGVITLHDKPA